LVPTAVMPGDLIILDLRSTPLDDEIMNCTIEGEGEEVYQWNFIDVSGEIPLDVKETFGALVVESCDGTVCPQDTNFTIDLTNLGSTGGNILITRFEASVNNGDPTNLINSLNNTAIGPNGMESVKLNLLLDVCTSSSVIVEVLVDVQSPSCPGVTYNFTIFVA